MFKNLIKKVWYNLIEKRKYECIFQKYSQYTMIPKDIYIENLRLVNNFKNIEGDIAECGTWKGAMIGGIADIVGDSKTIHLFDSFEGLPPVENIDGESANKWQSNIESDWYFDNCSTEIHFAENAMKSSKSENYKLFKG